MAKSGADYDANVIDFDPTGTGLVATDVQAALEEIAASGGGGGAANNPGAAAPYIGVWDNATAYDTGDVVDRYDSGSALWKLYQADSATTGDDPVDGSPWVDITAVPVVLQGTVFPVLAHAGVTDDDGYGLPGANGTLYLTGGGSYYGAAWIRTDYWYTWICMGDFNLSLPSSFNGGYSMSMMQGFTAGDGVADVYAGYRYCLRGGNGDGWAVATNYAQRANAGDGDAACYSDAIRSGSGTGNADATSEATVSDTATGTATAGGKAVHHTGGTAQVRNVANSTEAINQVLAPLEMTEQSDPAAPASNKARLYVKDNGSGKTQLVVLFPTGAVQVIATEP